MKYTPIINRTFKVVSTSGDEVLCVCPFHGDSAEGKPNLYVNAQKGVYLCHKCGAKGTLKPNAGSQRDLLLAADTRYLKERLSMLQQPAKHVTKPYPEGWLTQFDFPHEYWSNERGFTDKTVKLFSLGYDPVKDMLTIPIRASRGQVMGVIYRRLDDQKPKYLHPKGFKMGRDLFGSWLIRKRNYRRVALVEGPLDCVACWDAHVPAMALHGARLSPDQAKLVRALGITNVVCMTDNDGAGDEAVHSIKEGLPGINVEVGWYRDLWDAKDPGELHPRRRRQMFSSAVPYHRAWS